MDKHEADPAPVDRWDVRAASAMQARVAALRARAEEGSVTAEYAIVALAAAAFGGLLLAIFKGGEVRDLLLGIIRDALAR